GRAEVRVIEVVGVAVAHGHVGRVAQDVGGEAVAAVVHAPGRAAVRGGHHAVVLQGQEDARAGAHAGDAGLVGLQDVQADVAAAPRHAAVAGLEDPAVVGREARAGGAGPGGVE